MMESTSYIAHSVAGFYVWQKFGGWGVRAIGEESDYCKIRGRGNISGNIFLITACRMDKSYKFVQQIFQFHFHFQVVAEFVFPYLTIGSIAMFAVHALY